MKAVHTLLAFWMGAAGLLDAGRVDASDPPGDPYVRGGPSAPAAEGPEDAEVKQKAKTMSPGYPAVPVVPGAPAPASGAGQPNVATPTSTSSVGQNAMPFIEAAGSAPASRACRYAIRIHTCQREALEKAETKLEKAKKAMGALAEQATKVEGASAGFSNSLKAELDARAKDLKEAERAFGPEEASRLAALKEQGAELEEFCRTGGFPDPIYSLRLGVEGILAEGGSAFKIDDSKFTADTYFSLPLLFPARMSRVLTPKQYGLPALIDGKREEADRKTLAAREDLDEKKAALDVSERQLASAEAALLLEGERRPVDAAALGGAFLKANDARKARDEAAGNLRKAREKLDRDEQEADGVVCSAVRELEAAREDSCEADLFKPSTKRWDQLLAEPYHRFGPFAIPRAIGRATAPVWGWARLRWEEVPLAPSRGGTASSADGLKADVNEDRLTDGSKLSATLGLSYYRPLGRSAVVGATAGFGWYFGSMSQAAADPPANGMPEHVTWEGGLLMQTRYRVADLDRSAVAGVVGQIYLGYKRMNHLRNLVSRDGARRNEADRFVADFTLSLKQIASGSVQPLVYATIDKSLQGHENRDRVGVLLDVSLDRIFGPLIRGASRQVTAAPGP